MEELKFKILPVGLLDTFKDKTGNFIAGNFEKLEDSELSVDPFSFYTYVSAVFSSKIDGEAIELDAFIRIKCLGVNFLPDYTRKIDDLYEAYLFAQGSPLNPNAVKKGPHHLNKPYVTKKCSAAGY